MTRALLDTHTVLWWFTDDARLSNDARDLIADHANEVHVSAASAWEIATMVRLGKLDTVPHVVDRYGELVARNGFTHLSVDHRHALRAGSWDLPHRDPFDRLLAAQSDVESLDLVTRDPAFTSFGVATVW